MRINHQIKASQQKTFLKSLKAIFFLLSLTIPVLVMPLLAQTEEPKPLIPNPHQVYPSDSTMPKGIIGVAIYVSAHRIGDPAGLYIRAIHPEGPAAKSRLAHGDEIIAVDDTPLTGKTYEQIIRMIRGDIGQAVKLQVKSNQGIREVFIQRISETELMDKQKTS